MKHRPECLHIRSFSGTKELEGDFVPVSKCDTWHRVIKVTLAA
jgi:hypothetical protein